MYSYAETINNSSLASKMLSHFHDSASLTPRFMILDSQRKLGVQGDTKNGFRIYSGEPSIKANILVEGSLQTRSVS